MKVFIAVDEDGEIYAASLTKEKAIEATIDYFTKRYGDENEKISYNGNSIVLTDKSGDFHWKLAIKEKEVIE